MYDKRAPRVACYLKVDDGELLLRPTARDANGLGVTVDHPHLLQATATDAEVGATIRAIRQFCDYALYDENADPGERGWIRFARQHHCLDVILGETIQLIPTARDKRGAYFFLDPVELPGNVTDQALGRAVREAFSKCYEGEP